MKQNKHDEKTTGAMVVLMIIAIISVAMHPDIKFGTGILIILGSMFVGGLLVLILCKSDKK